MDPQKLRWQQSLKLSKRAFVQAALTVDEFDAGVVVIAMDCDAFG